MVMLTISSCWSNAINYDVKSQMIMSCSPKGMEHIDIKNDSLNDYYSIVWTDVTKNAPRYIDLKNIQKGFSIYKGWNDEPISVSDFKLHFLTKYTIAKPGGDAATYLIQVWTDSNGWICRTSQPNCK